MSVPLYTTPSHIELYAICIDDSLPKFTPDQWIKHGRLYKVKHFTDSLNTSGTAITIVDKNNNVIKPNESMFSFKEERFQIIPISLN